VTISGFVDIYYAYNFNTPATPCAVVNDVAVFNCLHVFDVAQNSFSLNLASFGLEKTPTADSRAGFRLDLMFGPGAGLVTGDGADASLRNVLEGYASYLIAPRGHLQVDAGRFTTPAGIEDIVPARNWNASRSLLFALAIPHEHVGLRVITAPRESLELTGFVANGWTDVSRNAGAQQVGASLWARPFRSLTFRQTYIGGPESTPTTMTNGWRDLWDTAAAVRVTSDVDVAFNLDLGDDRNTLQSWSGAAVYVRRRITDQAAVALRLEQLADHDGFMTGVSQDLQEATVTAEVRPAPQAALRLEYRIDRADTPYFLRSASTTVRTQNVISVDWVLLFGSVRSRPIFP
jgi:hypothetical protein